jgi:ABC-type multidrug transport system fused ATPase/permease subunit
VKFEYPTRKNTPVLNGLNITVDKGKVVALCGESGCGKSTMFSLLQRFYDPTEGQILIDGTDIRDFDVKHLRRMITIVSQEPNLFETSIKNNIAYGNPSATMEDIIQAAKSANAHDFIMSFEHGYDTLVGEGGSKLQF